MSNVIELMMNVQEDDKVWECSCGCQTFYIVDDSYVQCENCDVAHPIRCTLDTESSNDT